MCSSQLHLIHTALEWVGIITSFIAAALWIKATRVMVLSVGTAGWGALTGGYLVVPGPNNERIDLIATTKAQAAWNSRAAIATAVAVVLNALAAFFAG